jgi:hypothetical protein
MFKNNSMYQKAIFVLSLIFLMVQARPADAINQILVGNFSASAAGSALPEGWAPLTFSKIKQHTRYEMIEDESLTVVKAVSNASASGIIRKIKIDPRQYPIIKWRWKVSNIYQNGNVTQKSGDDYPARIYIGFEYDPDKVSLIEKAKFTAIKLIYGEYPPIGAINYIWESKAPVGTIVPNPYTDRVRMIVVESGKQNLNTWRQEERNIYEDYFTAFGEEPPMISGVSIMTDSDNTGESAVSYYGDIVFESKK